MKLKPSNLKQANKELEAFGEDVLKQIETINEQDRKRYAVVLLRIVIRPDQVKNDVQMNVQYFTEAGYEKIKDRFQMLGYTKLVLLHDPTKMDEDFTVKAEHEVKTEKALKEKIKSELLQEQEEEIEKRVAERLEALKQTKADSEEETKTEAKADAKIEVAKGNSDKDAPVDTDNVLDVIERGTVKDLRKFASNNEIDLSGQTAKDDILNTVRTWNEEQRENA